MNGGLCQSQSLLDGAQESTSSAQYWQQRFSILEYSVIWYTAKLILFLWRCNFDSKIFHDFLKNLETSCSFLFLTNVLARYHGLVSDPNQTISKSLQRKLAIVSWRHNTNQTPTWQRKVSVGSEILMIIILSPTEGVSYLWPYSCWPKVWTGIYK